MKMLLTTTTTKNIYMSMKIIYIRNITIRNKIYCKIMRIKMQRMITEEPFTYLIINNLEIKISFM